MNILQLTVFTWISAWVLCESFFPALDYKQKLAACCISAFAAAYANNAHGVVCSKIKQKLNN